MDIVDIIAVHNEGGPMLILTMMNWNLGWCGEYYSCVVCTTILPMCGVHQNITHVWPAPQYYPCVVCTTILPMCGVHHNITHVWPAPEYYPCVACTSILPMCGVHHICDKCSCIKGPFITLRHKVLYICHRVNTHHFWFSLIGSNWIQCSTWDFICDQMNCDTLSWI